MTVSVTRGTTNDILTINALIPEFDYAISEDKLQSRLKDRKSLLLIASVNEKLVGYKLGYALNEHQFYSWLGGVIPAYRKQSIARKLLNAQEAWAIEHSYKQVLVKSMNCFPAMLTMLINNGYQITGYENNGDALNSKIKFTKAIANTDI